MMSIELETLAGALELRQQRGDPGLAELRRLITLYKVKGGWSEDYVYSHAEPPSNRFDVIARMLKVYLASLEELEHQDNDDYSFE